MRKLSWKTLFFYLPDLTLLLFFFLSILNLDLVAFTSQNSTDFSQIFNGPFSWRPDLWFTAALWGATHSLEAVMFAKILVTLLGAYVLLKVLKTSASPKHATFFCLLYLFFPGLENTIRSFDAISWLPAFLFFSAAYLIRPMTLPMGPSRKKITGLLFLPALIVFLLNLSGELNGRLFQENTGRLDGNSMAMTLKMKKSIYSLAAENTGTDQDPFGRLHGRAVNQMRREELGPLQNQPRFGLYQALTNRRVRYDSELRQRPPENAWLFQLRNGQEMALAVASPFLLTELKANAFPDHLVIKYYNDKLEGIEKLKWPNSGLVLPMAFVREPEKVKSIRLEFDLDSRSNKYLNILADQYRLLQVRINRKMQAIFDQSLSHSEVQNQWVFKIADAIETAHIVIEMAVPSHAMRDYSRLDIFSTDYLIAPEDQSPGPARLLTQTVHPQTGW